jgi:hypothetical protein
VPKVLPVVAYTGKWTNDSTVALQLDPKVNPIAYAHRKDNDTFRLDVADRSAFTYSFNKLDSVKMTLQWMYYRSPFSDGKDDPLWRPNRDLAGADSIPDALFDELAELAGKMKNDLKLFVADADGVAAQGTECRGGCRQGHRDWRRSPWRTDPYVLPDPGAESPLHNFAPLTVTRYLSPLL